MRYIAHEKGGTASNLRIAETNAPEISDSQVLVKVAAFSVNRADILQRQGKYPPPKGVSAILGMDIAGEIVDCGAAVRDWEVGTKVCAMIPGGGYAEYAVVESEHLIAKPDALSMEEAASIPEVFLTAFQTLFTNGHLSPNQSVLIHAGASGVGLAAIQLAKCTGAKISVTASSPSKLQKCAQFGAHELVNYKEQDFLKVLLENQSAFELIVDVVGGDYTNKNLKLLKPDGRIVNLAILGGRFVENFDLALMLSKRATIMGSTLRNRSHEYRTKLVEEFSSKFLSLFDSQVLMPFVDTVFTAQDIALAHERIEANQSIGKFVAVW